MLSRLQIATITKTREILKRIEAISQAQTEREYEAGRMAEACHDAESSLLNVLLVDRYYLGEERITDEALSGKEDPYDPR